MKLAKDFLALCSWTMLHVIILVPRALNVEKHFAALFFFDWLEIAQLLPLIHTDIIFRCKCLMGALEKRPKIALALLTDLCAVGFK